MKRQYGRIVRMVSFFLLIHICANSQKNFRDGYVVLKTGDTLRGKIDYRNWEVNPRKVQFQQAAGVETYTAWDIKCFEVTGLDAYTSKIVTKDMRPVDINSITSGNFPPETTVKDTVFLRRLITGGRVSLYQLVDRKEHYFIQQGMEDSVQELGYKKFVDERTLQFYEEAAYKRQLAVLASSMDNPTLVIDKINRAQYDEKNIVTIVQLLNGDSPAMIKRTVAATKSPVSLMAGAGISYVNFKFTGELEKWTKLNFPGSIGQSVSMAVDFSGNRNFQQLAVRLGLSYSRQVYNGTQHLNDFFGKPSKNNYKLTQTSLVPELTLLYYFVRAKNVRVYGGAGLGFNISSYPVNTFTTTTLSTGEQSAENNPLDPEKVWLALNVMAGARLWDKVNVNLATIAGGGFINYTGLHSQMFPLALTVSYVFVSSK